MSTAEVTDAAASPLEVGYWLSSEEHGPRSLVRHAEVAEAHGFEHAMISDHFHPWVPQQGHAPFVWGVLGAIAARTERLHLATGVTAPTCRMHPVVVAQAAATAAVLLEGRFALGLGTGERLNEHVVGARWPRPGVRRQQLEEAISILRELLAGRDVTHDGEHFTVEHAQLYSRPEQPPDLWVAASGKRTLRLAGAKADGVIALAPDPALVATYRAAGGTGPVIGQLHVCWGASDDLARETARRWWPNAALPASVLAELARPQEFEDLVATVTTEAVSEAVVCGPDPEAMARAVLRFAAAGFTRVYVHQVGPDQEAFVAFWDRSVRALL
jgi:G6PDH family F420-dependent oxidoreductase